MKEARQRFTVIITSRKPKEVTSVTEDAENVALLTKCNQYNCGRRLFSGVLVPKFLKYLGGCFTFVRPKRTDLFSTSCLLNTPTNISRTVLNLWNVRAEVHA